MAIATTSCRTWQPVAGSPEALIAEERPERVRLTVPGGSKVTLRNPIVVNDSIVAAVAPDPNAPFAEPRPGVPASSVDAVEVATFSRARSIALGVGLAALSVGWARVASGSNSGEPDVEDPVDKDSFRPMTADGAPLAGADLPGTVRLVLWRLNW